MASNVTERVNALQEEIEAIDALCEQVLDRLQHDDGPVDVVYRAGQIMMASLIKEDILLRIQASWPAQPERNPPA